MKRVLSTFLLAVVLLISLASCGTSEGQTEKNNEEPHDDNLTAIVGLTEDDGFDYTKSTATESNGKYSFSIYLKFPITKETFTEHFASIKNKIEANYGIENCKSLAVYLPDNIVTCETNMTESLIIQTEYSESEGDDITDFGICIYNDMSIFSDLSTEFPDLEPELTVTYETTNHETMVFATGNGEIGQLINNRPEKPVVTTYNTWDDVVSDFPALGIYMAENETLSENDLRIYNEVWEVLDAYPDRSEEDIYEELAPNYGMTAEELESFIFDCMVKVYS